MALVPLFFKSIAYPRFGLISKKSSGYFNEIYQGRNLINTAILEKVSQSYEIKIKHSQVYEQNRLKQSLSSYAVIVKI